MKKIKLMSDIYDCFFIATIADYGKIYDKIYRFLNFDYSPFDRVFEQYETEKYFS